MNVRPEEEIESSREGLFHSDLLSTSPEMIEDYAQRDVLGQTSAGSFPASLWEIRTRWQVGEISWITLQLQFVVNDTVNSTCSGAFSLAFLSSPTPSNINFSQLWVSVVEFGSGQRTTSDEAKKKRRDKIMSHESFASFLLETR